MTQGTADRKFTILIAEDDSMMLKIVQMFLKKDEYVIISSVDGRDALEKFEIHNPDLIITDIMLPYLSGLEIVGKVKQSQNPIPVIVSSSMCQDTVMEEAKRLGADVFLQKPYDINQLLTSVSNIAKQKIAA